MRRRNTNKVLLFILLILIIVTVSIVVILHLKNKEEDNLTDEENEQEQQEVRYDNGDVSYYDHYKEGKVDIDVTQYVKLPENYLEYKLNSNEQEEIKAILYEIVANSEVEIPVTLLNGYYGDIYNSAKTGAELEQKELDEYIKGIYGYDTYQKYVEENTKYFEEEIKKDLVYQALAKEFNINITKNDIENYFAERIQHGDTYESLIDIYGEKLMYKYTLEDKIEKELTQRLAK